MFLPRRVQKLIHILPLGRICDIGHAQVARQDNQEPAQMHKGRGMGAREQDFHEREEGVEAVFGDVGPGVEADGEPAGGDAGAEDDAPVDDGDEERVADYAAVVQGVEGLEGPGKFGEEGCAVAGRR
ncbi:hypothetical protein DID88_008948 [Monilinia fructigena]|uniref:Uncharacterized protein n=1 Tax=Monilinia fructigena TaxID=38457 RepID=A0A395J6Z1_9HELO|nr:hypothetical protein DID88_008948 [Monilinia fructigena]